MKTISHLIITFLFTFLVSCHIVGSAITGEPIPSTSVQRAGHDESPVIHISSADLALAEESAEASALAGEAPPVHGLYDAGYLVARAREIAIEAVK